MRWIMSTEHSPAIAMPANTDSLDENCLVMRSFMTNENENVLATVTSAVVQQNFSGGVQLVGTTSSLKRSLNCESRLPVPAQKYCILKDSTGDCYSSKIFSSDSVKRSKTELELLSINSNAVTHAHGGVSEPQFQRLEKRRTREKEQYILQIQRAMIADEDGDRAIHISVVQEDVNLVQRLCKLMKSIGASMDIFNNLRQTPLHLAVIVGNPEIIKMLLHYGASVNARDRHGSNALQLAVKYFQEESFKVLLGDPNSRSALDSLDYEGLSAMHHAIADGNTSAVNFLYHYGGDVNAVDGKSGRSGLTQAVLNGNVEIVHLLLKCGACVAKMDYSGVSALDIAHQLNHQEIIQLLEKEAATQQDSEKEAESSITLKLRNTRNRTVTWGASKERNNKNECSAAKHVICTTRKKSVN